jgi:hypothetical protein
MSTEKASLTIATDTTVSFSTPAQERWRWLRFLRSPLWICLLIALLIRVWLLVHTRGVIAGDEALVGLQAENILRGQLPVYYYAQPYLGSLEAYFAALLFAIAGISVWTLRAVSIVLSVFLVFLTWRLAGAVVDTTSLPAYAKRRFRVIAALVAALPPVYDAVMEMHMWGGYIEAFVIIAWLLLAGFRLTQRWAAGASLRELALRWAGIGFLIGLGMWVDPLIVSAVAAIAVWIAGYCFVQLYKLSLVTMDEAKPGLFYLLKGLLLVVATIPAFLAGFAPAIYWGAKNQWQNIAYIFSHGGNNSLKTILGVQGYYNSCIAPRIIGGALPSQGNVSYANPRLLTFSLLVGGFCLFASIAAIGVSFFWRAPLLVNTRRLTGYALLFAVCSTAVFSISAVSIRALEVGCGPWDLVGRYATPLLVALPFFVAAIFTITSVYVQERGTGRTLTQSENGTEPTTRAQSIRATTRSPFTMVALGGLLVVLLVYLGLQSYAYFTADPGYTFQTSACTMAPANNDPIIAYLQSQHIKYVWSHGWMGDPIAFKTDGAIVTADARFLTGYQPYLGRIQAYTLAVWRADRPSVLILVHHNDSTKLQLLTSWNITYRVASFTSEPGYDVLVVTPLNRSLTPAEVTNVTRSFPGAFC